MISGNTLSFFIEQHWERANSLWNLRDRAVEAPQFRLNDLARLDERLAANIDGLRVAAEEGWKLSLAALGDPEPGAFFTAALLAIESGEPDPLEHVINAALDVTREDTGQPDFDPWRGVASAMAWANQSHAVSVIDRLIESSQPRFRSLAVAGCGSRRLVRKTNWEAALYDPMPLVRARAYRITGELGRTDLMAQLALGLRDDDPECRFWSAWAAARMGASEPFDPLADIAWQGGPLAEQALDVLLRRLDVAKANAWLREFARLPDCQRSLIHSTGVIGDPIYIPWLIERMSELLAARLAGEAFTIITGVDLGHRDFARDPPTDFQSGPNDDPADENVALDEDDRLPWPDPAKVAEWWTKNKARFNVGTAYFLGAPKASADWLGTLSDGFQRQRRAAALELAIRQPNRVVFEVRARGRLQRQMLARARGEV
jgi:uncharacterized protein (TIGR02270 family)